MTGATLQSVAGIVIRSGTIFLARRRPGGNIGGKWEFPGGKVESGETPKAALVREFMEELGVLIRVGQFIGENAFESDGRKFIVSAYDVQIDGTPHPGDEHVSTTWVELDRLGEIDLPESDRGLLKEVLRYGRERLSH